jgi:hypothetical protein
MSNEAQPNTAARLRELAARTRPSRRRTPGFRKRKADNKGKFIQFAGFLPTLPPDVSSHYTPGVNDLILMSVAKSKIFAFKNALISRRRQFCRPNFRPFSHGYSAQIRCFRKARRAQYPWKIRDARRTREAILDRFRRAHAGGRAADGKDQSFFVTQLPPEDPPL